MCNVIPDISRDSGLVICYYGYYGVVIAANRSGVRPITFWLPSSIIFLGIDQLECRVAYSDTLWKRTWVTLALKFNVCPSAAVRAGNKQSADTQLSELMVRKTFHKAHK